MSEIRKDGRRWVAVKGIFAENRDLWQWRKCPRLEIVNLAVSPLACRDKARPRSLLLLSPFLSQSTEGHIRADCALATE